MCFSKHEDSSVIGLFTAEEIMAAMVRELDRIKHVIRTLIFQERLWASAPSEYREANHEGRNVFAEKLEETRTEINNYRTIFIQRHITLHNPIDQNPELYLYPNMPSNARTIAENEIEEFMKHV